MIDLRVGDCIGVLAALDAGSVDAVVTDPPYGIGFMGHEWDQPGEYAAVTANGEPGLDERVGRRRQRQPSPASGAGHPREREAIRSGGPTGRDNRTHTLRGGAMHAGRYDLSTTANRRYQAWCEAWSAACLRVLKPGGHLVSFGGTRTYHRLVCGVEDAGFEVRDQLAWMFGSGFPKSLDVSKAIDAAAGAEREVVGAYERKGRSGGILGNPTEIVREITEPATAAAAAAWEGWGTALKPGYEPIVLARKPLAGTVAANVLAHGTGAINVDGCRVPLADHDDYERNHSGDRGHAGTREIADRGETDFRVGGGRAAGARWPANVVLDEPAAALLDEQSGELVSGANPTRRGGDKFRAAAAAAAAADADADADADAFKKAIAAAATKTRYHEKWDAAYEVLRPYYDKRYADVYADLGPVVRESLFGLIDRLIAVGQEKKAA